VTSPRIVFISPDLRAAGGAERLTMRLILGLRERGKDVTLLTLSDEGEHARELRERGVHVRCARMRARHDLAGLYRAAKATRESNAEVIVSHSVSAQVVGELAATQLGAPHITIEHGGNGLPLRRYQTALVRIVAPHVDRVVAVSSTQVPGLHALRFDPDRIHVIPNGIAPDDVRPLRSADEARAEFGLGPDDFVVLLAANLRPEKRAQAFVRAVATAAKVEPRIHGLVAGSGPERAAVEEEVRRAAGSVQLLGRREDVPDLLAASDVVCLTSAVEATPIVLLEAMAAGRPVLATAVGGVGQVVGDGVNGVLVPAGNEQAFANALVQLSRDPEGVAEMGRAGRATFLERFTFDRMVSSYEALIEDVLANR
jgi:glycosyltransferase involved in cell wall biosynthesis